MDKFTLSDDKMNRAIMQDLADTLRDLGNAMVQVSQDFDRLQSDAMSSCGFDTDFDHVWDSFDDGLTDLQNDDRLRDVWDRCKALQKRTRKLKDTLHHFS